nr:immunoglobulin light chain junction region [Mus musculus]NSL99136.1 immunoglobulin light chain junction region [Mus musculus]NSM01011.1 immunoglobulin light chain junction region [Mus musculus]NSM02977.1 immunoglobulin light chain junction region [Mus musculus]
CQQYWSTPLTF